MRWPWRRKKIVTSEESENDDYARADEIKSLTNKLFERTMGKMDLELEGFRRVFPKDHVENAERKKIYKKKWKIEIDKEILLKKEELFSYLKGLSYIQWYKIMLETINYDKPMPKSIEEAKQLLFSPSSLCELKIERDFYSFDEKHSKQIKSMILAFVENIELELKIEREKIFGHKLDIVRHSQTVIDRCAYCHDDLEKFEIVECGDCLTGYHKECAEELGRCATIGCPSHSGPSRVRE